MTMACNLRLLTALVSLTTVVQGFVPAQRFTVHPTKFQFHKKGPLVAVTSTASSESEEKQLIGDDSAYFSIKEQKLGDWITFSAATGFVLVALSFLWFLPFGPHWGDAYLEFTQAAIGTTDTAPSMFALLTIFAVFHSGLAGILLRALVHPPTCILLRALLHHVCTSLKAAPCRGRVRSRQV